MVIDEDIEKYDRDGYAVFRNVVDQGMVYEVRQMAGLSVSLRAHECSHVHIVRNKDCVIAGR